MARPFKHEISILINEGREREARRKLTEAIVEGGGTARGAMRVLGAPHTVVWRWMQHLGVSSSYDRRAGAYARHAKQRQAKSKEEPTSLGYMQGRGAS